MRRALSLALSLIACLLLMAIWIRSYSVTDTFFWGTAKSDHHFYSTGGRLIYAGAHWPNGRAPFALTHNRIPRHSPVWLVQSGHSDGFRTLGFEYSTEVFPEMDLSLSFFIPPYRVIAIPYWALSAIVMLTPWPA
jgi:hypothetical protein